MPEISEIPAATTTALEAFFADVEPRTRTIGQPVDMAMQALRDFTLTGGKRLRPTFAWAGYLGAHGPHRSGEDEHAVLTALASLELIQACALIHDDIIDSSDTRRGKPTVHKKIEADLLAHNPQSTHATEFGTSIALLIGDLALAWAEDMLTTSGLSDAALHRTREPWQAMRTEVIGGQILDITAEALNRTDFAAARQVNTFKTAAYTITRPLHLGAAIANAPAAVIDAYTTFGNHVGVAFQLRDDLLGVFGDPAITGKPIGDDLREGKRTELVAAALDRLTGTPAADELTAGLGTVTAPDDIAHLSQILLDCGAVDEIEQRITELTETGLAGLTDAPIADDAAEMLRALAEKATKRIR
ncbi:MAG: polyprenyl synthetase family protein [Corynebacterium sp.]|nr:polyprenyl synthetase family protein [Corynebacterium sp.]